MKLILVSFQNDIIIESFELEMNLKITLVPAPLQYAETPSSRSGTSNQGPIGPYVAPHNSQCITHPLLRNSQTISMLLMLC